MRTTEFYFIKLLTCILILGACQHHHEQKKGKAIENIHKDLIANIENKLFLSSTINKKTPSKKIKIDVSKTDTIWLSTWENKQGIGGLHTCWASPSLIDENNDTTWLTTLPIIATKTGWDRVRKETNYRGDIITIAGKRFSHSILAHANSQIAFALDKKYKTLQFRVGLEEGASNENSAFFTITRGSLLNQFEKITTLCNSLPHLKEQLSVEQLLKIYLSDTPDQQLKQLAYKLGSSNNKIESYYSEQLDLANNSEQIWNTIIQIAEVNRVVKTLNHDLFTPLRKTMLFLKKHYALNTSQFEEELDMLEKQLKTCFDDQGHLISGKASLMGKTEKQLTELKRKILLAHPLLKNGELLFTTHDQYLPDHHNTATLFQTNEINTNSFRSGGSLKKINLSTLEPEILLSSDSGLIRDPEIHFNGRNIVFSMRKDINDNYHIYEIDIEGNNLKQLTSANDIADIDPLYIPNNQIVFSSTREPKYCMCNVHIMGNLFRMNSDGSNITQLGKSSLFEGHSTLLPDGKILYDRWEYVDRNFGDAQGLWTVNTDGTNHAVYYGNNLNSPGGVIDARPIPNTDKVVAILGSCHDRPWGAMAIIDRKEGVDSKDAIQYIWPQKALDRFGKGNWDAFKGIQPLYEDPFPIDENYFLCSKTISENNLKQAIFIVDTFGNELMIHSDTKSCFDPMLIAPHPEPTKLAETRNYKTEKGYFYIQNVYEGTHMKGVEKGSVKYLRVVESLEKRSWTIPAWQGQGVHRPAMNWHSFECKKIWGTVPIYEDGSAYFEVPADRYVYFQLLDKDKKMIQSMRSGTMVQSGEKLGCIGCHENRRSAPPQITNQQLLALQNEPSSMNGWYGSPRSFGFMKEVQPIFNRKCVKCHDFNKKAGKRLLLAKDKNPFFNAAYMDLWLKEDIKAIGAGPSEIQQAYSWGSHPSRLIKTLEQNHHNVRLTTEEMERLTTWIDLNAVYYPNFISAYPNNLAGRSPLNDSEINRLSQLTGINLKRLASFRRKLNTQISFDRPHLSPCLSKLEKNSSEFKEAIEIIKRGTQRLKQTPRLDMPNFIPCDQDIERLEKYNMRRAEEQKNREAIQVGKKYFDHLSTNK